MSDKPQLSDAILELLTEAETRGREQAQASWQAQLDEAYQKGYEARDAELRQQLAPLFEMYGKKTARMVDASTAPAPPAQATPQPPAASAPAPNGPETADATVELREPTPAGAAAPVAVYRNLTDAEARSILIRAGFRSEDAQPNGSAFAVLSLVCSEFPKGVTAAKVETMFDKQHASLLHRMRYNGVLRWDDFHKWFKPHPKIVRMMTCEVTETPPRPALPAGVQVVPDAAVPSADEQRPTVQRNLLGHSSPISDTEWTVLQMVRKRWQETQRGIRFTEVQKACERQADANALYRLRDYRPPLLRHERGLFFPAETTPSS